MVEWRLSPTYPDYEASSAGEVRRVDGEPVRVRTTWNGYLRVPYRGSSRLVHRIVADAFLGLRPEGHLVHHQDRNRQHNAPSNLEYVTQAQHAKNHFGGDYEIRPISVVEKEFVMVHRAAGERGPKRDKGRLTQRELATRLGISRYRVWRIQRGA